MKPAGIIQFADGTYHGGGTSYCKPKKNINAAKTYVSTGKAESVLKLLKKSYDRSIAEGARVLPVNITVASDQSEEVWTVLHNHGEYAKGLFPTQEAAIAEVIELTRHDCILEDGGMSDEDIYDYADGYYREIRISGGAEWDLF